MSAFASMTEATSHAARHGFAECTEEVREDAFGSMFPAEFFNHGFAMGESYSYDPKLEADTYFCFFEYGGRYWVVLSTLERARRIQRVDDHGILVVNEIPSK